MNTIVKNILIAVGVGIIVGILIGGVIPLLGVTLPASYTTAGVGLAIGFTFVLLNSRKV
jgi:hypothetical protein